MANLQKLLARAEPILARLPAGRPVMVELGTYAGDLARLLLERRPDLTLHCIDNWLAAELQPEAYVATGDVHATLSQAKQNDLLATTRARLAPFGDRAIVQRMASTEAAALFLDQSVDLVFLDADHSYDAVLADCRAWWPKIKAGGSLGGHDYDNRDPRFAFGVDAAVTAFSTQIVRPFEVDRGHTWWIRKPHDHDRPSA